jgi:5-methylcytosine-specific restriction protein A
MTYDGKGWRGQRGTRHERGYGAAWVRLRRTILQRDRHLCQPCLARGRPTPARTVDHIKPKAEGGTDDSANLRAICDECHKAKTTDEGHRAKGDTLRLRRDDGW